jgi:hypothetical protein
MADRQARRPRISVTVSENRQRGRPPKYDLEVLRQDPRLARRSTRTLQNALYEARAARLLDRPEHQPWVRWLFEPRRPTILAELGRVKERAMLVERARWMCEQQPRTHDAVEILRHARATYRGGGWDVRRWQCPEQALADRLLAEINRHALVPLRVSPTIIRKALTLVRKTLAVSQALEKLR